MYAVGTFLIVVVITTVFVQMATGALISTGLPPEIAAFQARSAFSGAGFTTAEAENVVNHPKRRRIISTTMFAGSLGTPALVVTVLVGLIAPGPGSTAERSLVVLAGIAFILLLIVNRPVRRLLVGIGQRYATHRLSSALDAEPTRLLDFAGGFEVDLLALTADPDQAVRGLRGLENAFPGVRVLGVRRGDQYFGEPPVDLTLVAGDELVLYGHRDRIAEVRGNN